MKSIYVFFICIIAISNIFAQLQPYGLQDKVITSLAAEELDYQSTLQFPFDYLLAGTDSNGVFQASPSQQSAQWSSLGLEDKYIQSLTVQHWGAGPADGLTAYAGINLYNNSADSILIFKREIHLHGDTIWVPADSGINSTNKIISALNAYYYTGHTPPGNLLAGTYSGLYLGTHVNFWTEVDHKAYISAIDIYPHWFGRLAWAAGGLGLGAAALRSDDGGLTWKMFYPPSPSDGGANSLCINTRNTDSVYFSVNGSIYLTPDSGHTFTHIFSDTTGRIRILCLDPLHPENIYAAGSGSSANSLYLISSANGGKTWDLIFPNMLPIYIAEATSLAVVNNQQSDETFIFIGTSGTGVWKYTPQRITSTGDEETFQGEFRLYQNYPNPFNPATNFEFRIPASPAGGSNSRNNGQVGFVSLKIYDILGNEIATLINEEKPAGDYKIQFNASNLTSGIYFYVLNAGGKSISKKMCLLK